MKINTDTDFIIFWFVRQRNAQDPLAFIFVDYLLKSIDDLRFWLIEGCSFSICSEPLQFINEELQLVNRSFLFFP